MNLFPKQTTPYFIVAPAYTHMSSGVRALHTLCHALNESGQKAYIWPLDGVYLGWNLQCVRNPYLNTPGLTDSEYQFYGSNFIAVYPDIIAGNPLKAEKVVRYLLAPPGEFGGDVVFSENDQLWSYSPYTARFVGNENILRPPLEDMSIFHNNATILFSKLGEIWETKVRERSGACFYSHKYDKIHGNELLPITDGMTRLEGSLEEMAAILRKSEVCYLYEHTSVLVQAQLCGCPVVLIRSPYMNEIKWAEGCPLAGVRWNDEERVLGEDWQKAARFFYKEQFGQFDRQLEDFIKRTQQWTK